MMVEVASGRGGSQVPKMAAHRYHGEGFYGVTRGSTFNVL
jgi:hypothetical protein